MVKQVPYFEDSAGKPHKTQYDAWRAELVLWLNGTKALSNETQAKAIVDHIIAGGRQRIDQLRLIVTELQEAMPETPMSMVVFEDDAS